MKSLSLPRTDRPRILFVCTGNSCRSPLAEVIVNHFSGGTLDARSAGTHPAGYVHPVTIALLDQMGLKSDGLRSRGWHELAGMHVDAVITLCDDAARCVGPLFAGPAVRIHWGFADPARHAGPFVEKLAMAGQIADRLLARLDRLCEADYHNADTARSRLENW